MGEDPKVESDRPAPAGQPSPLFLLQKQLTLQKQVGDELRRERRELERQLAAAPRRLEKLEPDELEVVVLRDATIAGVPKGIGEPVARVRLGAGVPLYALAGLIADGSAG